MLEQNCHGRCHFFVYNALETIWTHWGAYSIVQTIWLGLEDTD